MAVCNNNRCYCIPYDGSVLLINPFYCNKLFGIMKRLIAVFGLSMLLTCAILMGGAVSTSQAQCAMCTLNAEQSVKDGNTQGQGLNKGILFLLAMPYLAIGAVGYLWYKKYRRKKAETKLDTGAAH